RTFVKLFVTRRLWPRSNRFVERVEEEDIMNKRTFLVVALAALYARARSATTRCAAAGRNDDGARHDDRSARYRRASDGNAKAVGRSHHLYPQLHHQRAWRSSGR